MLIPWTPHNNLPSKSANIFTLMVLVYRLRKLQAKNTLHHGANRAAEMDKDLHDAQLKFISWQDSLMLSSRPICRTSFEPDRSSPHSTQSTSGRRPFVRPLPAIPHPSAAAHLPAPGSAPPAMVVHRSQQLSPRPLSPLPPLPPVSSSDGKSTSPSSLPPKLDSVWAYVDSGVPPEVPSPTTTAQRRHVAKLRRHLGKSVVDLLVDRGDTLQLGAGHSRSMSLSVPLCRSAHGHGADSAETSEDEEELEDVVSQEHEGVEEGEEADYSSRGSYRMGGLSKLFVGINIGRNGSLRREVRRWVVDDYDEVLHALRTL
ncbi:hypothetical protein K443DRAFT_10310 [Laccaria amethystina LaAM-08-1]|uniref:Uncharacterized protein n=1 Tax=Laccaria amethystina LaAM-08-1 TaxID=1095629 RepID=A0A0C9XGS6_9AGAR|nr:hypothetical protein K443DRAFT_10310 [Laccaria amethystina LaAM-08-1]